MSLKQIQTQRGRTIHNVTLKMSQTQAQKHTKQNKPHDLQEMSHETSHTKHTSTCKHNDAQHLQRGQFWTEISHISQVKGETDLLLLLHAAGFAKSAAIAFKVMSAMTMCHPRCSTSKQINVLSVLLAKPAERRHVLASSPAVALHSPFLSSTPRSASRC